MIFNVRHSHSVMTYKLRPHLPIQTMQAQGTQGTQGQLESVFRSNSMHDYTRTPNISGSIQEKYYNSASPIQPRLRQLAQAQTEHKGRHDTWGSSLCLQASKAWALGAEAPVRRAEKEGERGS